MELQHEKNQNNITFSTWRRLLKEESADIFTWEQSMVSINQNKNQDRSMQGVETHPNLYCVSLVGDSWAWETHSNTCSLVQLLLTETPSSLPSLSLSLLHTCTLHGALTSQSVPLHCNLQPHTSTNTHARTHALSRLSSLISCFRQAA